MVDTTNLVKQIKTPNQASTVFSLDGNTVPRKKSLFYVRFRRAGSDIPDWQANLGFVVKHLDRPAIQPEIQELNQYNKKRQVTTGFKIQPMKMTLYDTADNLVMRMWDDYSRWYFGDFGQEDESNFSYDVTTPSFNDNGSGFGYVPRSGDSVADLNSQFFFEKIEVYQVFGGQLTQFDLINPKINSFDPDELDYESTTVSMISMSISYEAILYRNQSSPTAIDTNAIDEAFQGKFNGQTINVVGAPTRKHAFTGSNTNPQSMGLDAPFGIPLQTASFLSNATSTTGSGVLGQYGNFNFGSADLNNISSTSFGLPALTSSLNLPTDQSVTSINALTSGPITTPTIDGAGYDSASATLQGFGATSGNAYANNYINTQLTGGVMASSMLDNNSPSDQLVKSDQTVVSTDQQIVGNGPDTTGLTLNSQSYGIVNAQRDSSTQLGVNSTSDYIANAKAATDISDLLNRQSLLAAAISETKTEIQNSNDTIARRIEQIQMTNDPEQKAQLQKSLDFEQNLLAGNTAGLVDLLQKQGAINQQLAVMQSGLN